MGYYWRHQVEYIVFCTKNKTKRYVTSGGNILAVSRVPAKQTLHPNQKPVELYQRLLEASGGPILEPFAGSAPAARAAKILGLECWSIEKEEKFCQTALTLLKDLD